jgi:hypothetical protein
LLDVAITADRIVTEKEAEKKLTYKTLRIEVQLMWNMKCMIIKVIIGATRTVTKSLKKNLEDLIRKHSIRSLQNTAILGTSHIMWKVLQSESWRLCPMAQASSDHRWFKRSTKGKNL